MAVSLKELQEQLDALKSLCPRLLPAVVPHGYEVQDLWGLVQTESKASKDELRGFLSEAAKQHDASGQGCCVCGADGQARASHEATADESLTLRFTVFPETSFSDRTVTLAAGGFACGSCRAMRDAQRFAHFAASRTSAAHPEREALAKALVVHFTSVNDAPAVVQGSEQAQEVWTQEVVARAYALGVVASGIDGWRMLGPRGSGKASSSGQASSAEGLLVRRGVPGTSLKLARALLSAGAKQSAAAAITRGEAEGSEGTGKRRLEGSAAGAPGKKQKSRAAAEASAQQGGKDQAKGKTQSKGRGTVMTPQGTPKAAVAAGKAAQTPAGATPGKKAVKQAAADHTQSGKKKGMKA